jgi:ribosomal protein S18 acetylase RimI-like enzyme
VDIVTYRDEYFGGVKTLWQEAFPEDPPWNTPEIAIPAKMATQPDLFVLATDGATVIGSIMAGYDGHRGWLYFVAVLASHRRRGVATALVREAERRLQMCGCAKINLQIRPSNAPVVEFYKSVGYEIEARISMGKRVAPISAI